MWSASPLVFHGPQIHSRREMSDPHRVIPVDVASAPFGPCELQTPQRAGLGQNAAAFVHNNAEMEKNKSRER